MYILSFIFLIIIFLILLLSHLVVVNVVKERDVRFCSIMMLIVSWRGGVNIDLIAIGAFGGFVGVLMFLMIMNLSELFRNLLSGPLMLGSLFSLRVTINSYL